MQPGNGPIVWLASFPKSGNTWLRAMLTALVDASGSTPDLAQLVGATELVERQFLDDWCGIDSADLTREQLLPYMRLIRLIAADQATGPAFVKTHDRFGTTADGQALFPAEATRATVLILRHPFDVAISLAAHYGSSLDVAIARMADPNYGMHLRESRGSEFLPVEIGSWSGFARSWLDQRELPVQLLRYEDMLADPVGALLQVAQAAGLACDFQKAAAAAEACSFKRLQAAEAKAGFSEKPAGMTRFFRTGQSGTGSTELSPAQQERIVAVHGSAMVRLGYATNRG